MSSYWFVIGSWKRHGLISLPLVGKADLPRPPLAFGVIETLIPHLKKKVKMATAYIPALALKILPLLPTEATPSAIAEGVGEMPPSPSSSSSTMSLPELVKKFE